MSTVPLYISDNTFTSPDIDLMLRRIPKKKKKNMAFLKEKQNIVQFIDQRDEREIPRSCNPSLN